MKQTQLNRRKFLFTIGATLGFRSQVDYIHQDFAERDGWLTGQVHGRQRRYQFNDDVVRAFSIPMHVPYVVKQTESGFEYHHLTNGAELVFECEGRHGAWVDRVTIDVPEPWRSYGMKTHTVTINAGRYSLPLLLGHGDTLTLVWNSGILSFLR